MFNELNTINAEKIEVRSAKEPSHPALIKIIDLLAKLAVEDYLEEIKKNGPHFPLGDKFGRVGFSLKI